MTGLGLPLAVVISPGPVSLVTSVSMMTMVTRLSESNAGEENCGDDEEFHDETSCKKHRGKWNVVTRFLIQHLAEISIYVRPDNSHMVNSLG